MRYSRFLATTVVVLCASALFAQAPPRSDQVIVIQGRREASEASGKVGAIRYIPFTVPAGVTRISIKPTFDWGIDASQKHTVDTGLFDFHGYGFGSRGFRGWQGGNESEILITGDPATTSRFYIAGDIHPGTWNIVQRFLKSPAFGLNYKYTITLSFSGPAPPSETPAPPACDQGVLDAAPGWYPGDMHLHTIHSDGNKTLVESMVQHESQGYRFMVSTDHNTSRTHYDFAEAARAHPKTLLICGEEWTTAYGHANVVGMRPGSWFDFRVDAKDGKLPGVIDSVHQQGAMFVINHPCSIKWTFPDNEWTTADAIEVWNGGWGADDRQAVELWDKQLREGRHMAAIGGTDTHGGNAHTPVTWVYANNLSLAAITDGLHKEHVFVAESPKGPKLFLTSGTALPGDTVRVGKDGVVAIQARVVGGKGMTLCLIWSGSQEKIAVRSDDVTQARKLNVLAGGYVRAELVKADGGMAALTNAIYVEKP